MNESIKKKLDGIKHLSQKEYLFHFIPLFLAAMFLAGTAAYFSVFGLSKVFAGAKLPAIIMASAIEFGKIVAVSFTNKYWSSIGKMRGYLLIAIIIAMLVTSASIFGFLSDAYQRTANELSTAQSKVEIENNKKTYILQQIENYNKQSDFKDKRITQLNELRAAQETRLDSMYAKSYYTTAKRTEKLISDANQEIIDLTGDISEISSFIISLNDSINAIDIKILDLNSTDASAELGPIIFVKDLFNTEMNTVVVIFIIMLIFVFDPMAMALIIAMNKLMAFRNDSTEEIIKEYKSDNASQPRSIEERFEEINNKTPNGGLVVKPQIISTDENKR